MKALEHCGLALKANSLEWFDVEIIDSKGSDIAAIKPDAIMCPETLGDWEALSKAAGIPIIIICKNQTNQMALRKILTKTLPDCAKKHFQIIAQPLGPIKLSQVYQHVFTQRSTTSSTMIPPLSLKHVPIESNGNIAYTDPPLVKLHSPPQASTGKDERPIREGQIVRANDESRVTPPLLAKTTESQAPRPMPIRLRSGLSEHPTKTHHILCVDDNQVNQRLLTMFMRKIKLPYSSASNGLEALEKYVFCANSSCTSEQSPSPLLSQPLRGPPTPPTSPDEQKAFTYVLMDISMPVMDGLESTRRIRAFEKEMGMQKAVIIALTGLASAEAQRDALDAGVDFYLAKPVKFVDLQKLMEV